MAVLVGKADVTGHDRAGRDQGQPLAGKSTLNRLELTPVGADARSRYHKIVAKHGELEQSFVEIFIEQHATPPREIVLDLDATDDRHGRLKVRSWDFGLTSHDFGDNNTSSQFPGP